MRGRPVWLWVLALAVCAACFLLAPPVIGAEKGAQEAGARDASFVGIGAMLEAAKNEDTGEVEVVVTGTLDGGPAAEAGIQKGDVITHVDGAPTAGIPLHEVVALIRGEAGTELKLMLKRAGQDDPIEVALERKEIAYPVAAADREVQGGLAAERGEDFQRMAAEQDRPFTLQFRRGMGQIVEFVGGRGPTPRGAPAPEAVPAQMLVKEGYVYVLRGCMLYQFKVEGLVLVAKHDLRTDEEK